MSLQEKFNACKEAIGKRFPYRDCYIYPHGKMVSAVVENVKWFSDYMFDIFIKIQFTDGYEASFVTDGECFYDNTLKK